MASIELKNVTKIYEGFKALDALNLTVPSGSVYGLIGAQGRSGGTGKSANRFCRPATARRQRNPKGGVGFFSNIVIKIEGSGSHAVIKRAQTRLCGLLLLLAFRCNSQ